MRQMTFGFLAVALLLAAGCETGEPRAGEPVAPAYAAEVAMTDDATFIPDQVTVQVGDTVLWRNTSSEEHTVTADEEQAEDPDYVQVPAGAESFDSGVIRPGETYEYTFETPGTYRYFCTPHQDMGMIGEVHVESAAGVTY